MKIYNKNFIEKLNQYIDYLISCESFYKNPEPEYEDEFTTYIHRIAYYNFINWQCENISKSTSSSLSTWGYNGTVLFNRLRNENIMKLDSVLNTSNNVDDVYCIPTTFGLIIDSYIILQIKNMYNKKLSNCNKFENQCEYLAESILKTLNKFYEKQIKFLNINKQKVFI